MHVTADILKEQERLAKEAKKAKQLEKAQSAAVLNSTTEVTLTLTLTPTLPNPHPNPHPMGGACGVE